MNTVNLIKVLDSMREKQVITLPKVTSAELFWHDIWKDDQDLSDYMYNPITKKWEIYDGLYEFDDIETRREAERKLDEIRQRAGTALLANLAHMFADSDSLELVNNKGKLLKRFNRFVKQRTGVEIDSAALGVIGDKLQFYATDEVTMTFDFTDCIDWEDGYFGKSGSCWWGLYSDSIPTFENAGGWAVRFYQDMDDWCGIGRTWILPYNDALLCFNSYGVERPFVIRLLKQVFQERGVTLHHAFREIENYYSDTVPYINGGSGFVLAEQGHDYLINTYRIEPHMELCYDNHYHCESCNRRLDSDEVFSTDYGDTYCMDCYYERYFYCDGCDRDYPADERVLVHTGRGTRHVCGDCATSELGAAMCQDCNEWYTDYYVTADSEYVYCESCVEKYYLCEECGEIYEYEEGCENCRTGCYAGEEQEDQEQGATDPDVTQSVQTIQIKWGIV